MGIRSTESGAHAYSSTACTDARDVACDEVGADAVPAHGVAPAASVVAGDVDAHLTHQVRFDEHDVQRLAAAPPDGERPPCPGVVVRRRGQ